MDLGISRIAAFLKERNIDYKFSYIKCDEEIENLLWDDIYPKRLYGYKCILERALLLAQLKVMFLLKHGHELDILIHQVGCFCCSTDLYTRMEQIQASPEAIADLEDIIQMYIEPMVLLTGSKE